MRFWISALILLLLLSSSFAALDLTLYYGTGCAHCAKVDVVIDGLEAEYGLNVERKEIYYDAANRQEMFDAYVQFGKDPGSSGVPTILLDSRSLLIGEMDEARFREIFDAHIANRSLNGVYTADSFSPIEEKDPTAQLTLWVLVAAAAADSVNPCTIAVMAMLLGVILQTKGRKQVLQAALTFIGIVFIAYLLMGIGLLQTITNTELTNIFFSFVTVAVLILAILEIKAYFQYEPGFLSVEIPMFLRPYMKKAIANATSIPGVAFAALICSLFLLPCSSGPYLVVLSMLAQSVTLQGMLYLVVYNLIFIMPMLIVAFMIYTGKASLDDVGEFREQHIRTLHLISGLVFIILFLVLLNQMFGFLQI